MPRSHTDLVRHQPRPLAYHQPVQGEARVWVDGREPASVKPEGTVVLGRADAVGGIGLDPDDRGISAHQAEIVAVATGLVIRNLSSSRAVAVEYRDRVRHSRVLPGDTHQFVSSALVLITGIVRTHGVGVETPRGYEISHPAPSGDTSVGTITLSERDRQALAALYSGYLHRWPRHRPEPISYDEAGLLIGETGATVRKRIERIRERVNATGVAYIDGRSALRDLADHLVEIGQMHPSDLERLGQPVQWRGPQHS